MSEAFPLTPGQKSLWYMQQVLPGSAVNHIALAVRIVSALDVSALRTALQTIVERHDSLRTVVRIEASGELAQAVCAGGAVAFEIIDTAGLPADEIDTRITAAFRRPFDLAAGPLFRSHLFTNGDDGHLLLVTAHHLVFDALSLGRVFTELLELYSAARSGRDHGVVPVKATYHDFVKWQQQMLAGPEGDAHLTFWREQLDGAPPVLDLPTDHPRSAHPSGRGDSIWFPIDDDLARQLKALAATLDIFLFDIFAAAWQVLLYRYSRQSDMLTGFVTGSRPSLRFARTVGSFSNVIALRACFDDDPPFVDFVRRQHARLADGLAHADYPFPLLVEKLRPLRVPGHMPLTQVLFTYFMAHGSRIAELSVSGHRPEVVQTEAFAMESYGLKQDDLEFDLALSVAEGERCWSRLRFDTALFDRTTIERLAAHYLNLLSGVAADPSQTVSSIPLLSEAERQDICRPQNRTVGDRAARTAGALFEAQVGVAPDRVAVVCGNRQLTYAELNERAASIAAYLRRSGTRRGDLVAICMERSVDMLAALLAVWKAGAAYVPLDPHFPQARLDLIVADAAPRTIITEAPLADRFARGTATVIDAAAAGDHGRAELQADVMPSPSGSDLAYVIYTSGSTGRPKGVEIPHSALTNFLLSMRERPGLTRADVLLAVTTLSFDIAALELFLPLIVGATVVIAGHDTARDGRQLARELERRGASVMQATPAGWRVLIDSGWRGCARLTAVCGGEALPRDLADRLLPRVRSLWNMYGPTETTVWSALHEVGPDDDPIPLGVPVDNTSLYVLDRRLQPVPIGVAGELHIGGAGLARGYRNLPDLTTSRFIEHPFVPGERLYKTGDLCRVRADGSILFLGRLDDQVKLHGHRIEPGEIESVLARHGAVKHAAVVLAEQPHGPRRLIAYVVPHTKTLPLSSLRTFLTAHLPGYMVPSVFVYVDSLPLTPNAKVDRKALRELAVTSSAAEEREYVPPRTPTEAAVAALWAEILKLPRVGVEDRFDELGGDSLAFALMTVRAGSQLGLDIPMRMDADMLTVRGFARTADGIARQAAEAPVFAPASANGSSSVRTEPLRKTWHGRMLVKTCAALVRCLVSIEVDGLENLPVQGPAIVAGNHVSLFDFAILGSVLGSMGERVPITPTFLIADKWRWLAHPFASQLGHTIYIRRGQGDMEALEAAREVLARRGALAITPEGRPTRGGLARAKPGVAYLACESGAPVWPMAIFGHERIFDFWKRLRRVPVRIRVGTSLVLGPCDGEPGDLQLHADFIMAAIAELMPPEYHGVYVGAARVS